MAKSVSVSFSAHNTKDRQLPSSKERKDLLCFYKTCVSVELKERTLVEGFACNTILVYYR